MKHFNVAGAIVVKNDSILFERRAKEPFIGKLVVPGGK